MWRHALLEAEGQKWSQRPCQPATATVFPAARSPSPAGRCGLWVDPSQCSCWCPTVSQPRHQTDLAYPGEPRRPGEAGVPTDSGRVRNQRRRSLVLSLRQPDRPQGSGVARLKTEEVVCRKALGIQNLTEVVCIRNSLFLFLFFLPCNGRIKINSYTENEYIFTNGSNRRKHIYLQNKTGNAIHEVYKNSHFSISFQM